MGEGGQADHPFDRFIVFATGAQQVEESGQKNHLQKYDEQHAAARLFNLYLNTSRSRVLLYMRTAFTHKSPPKHVQQRITLTIHDSAIKMHQASRPVSKDCIKPSLQGFY